MSLSRSPLFALAVTLAALLPACQKSDDHPPYSAGCEGKCPLLPGISVGAPASGGSSSMNPDLDGGTGTLQGQVFQLTDDSFAQATKYAFGATVTADGANGTPVTASWEAADEAYTLEGVARLATNWVNVKPTSPGGDALLTYQAVQTNRVTNANLYLASASTLYGIFNSVPTTRSPNLGQVVLFFRSAGTGVPLAGLHVVLNAAQAALYASASGWVLDDGTTITGKDGLVLFGNVDAANSSGTQTVTVTRAATATTAATAAGQFAVKVVQGAVTLASVDVQL